MSVVETTQSTVFCSGSSSRQMQVSLLLGPTGFTLSQQLYSLHLTFEFLKYRNIMLEHKMKGILNIIYSTNLVLHMSWLWLREIEDVPKVLQSIGSRPRVLTQIQPGIKQVASCSLASFTWSSAMREDRLILSNCSLIAVFMVIPSHGFPRETQNNKWFLKSM